MFKNQSMINFSFNIVLSFISVYLFFLEHRLILYITVQVVQVMFTPKNECKPGNQRHQAIQP